MINNIEYNDVLVTISGYHFAANTCEAFSENFLNIEKKYYAKNIGLIKEEYKSDPDDEYITVREIVNWEINSPY